MSAWPIYTGTSEPHDRIDQLPEPPNWRAFTGDPPLPIPTGSDAGIPRRLGTGDERPDPDALTIQMVNAALFLRRPLLVTGRPGTGKSTLAYAVARELRLGPVLRWPITSRSALRADGLYRYDPIGRLREQQARQARAHTSPPGAVEQPSSDAEDIGRHLRLGPLGTALLPWRHPRVLLIDEIDKSDIDLPNDLLNVFEDGEYEIDELARLPAATASVPVLTADGATAGVRAGRVVCRAFPFIVLTSNGEREFPAAFLRRCLRLDLQPPRKEQLVSMLTAHLGPEAAQAATKQVERFLELRDRTEVTTDQLLNAVYLATSGSRDPGEASLDDVVAAVMRPLTGPG